MSELRDGLAVALEEIVTHRDALAGSLVGPSATRAELVAAFPESIPTEGASVGEVLEELVDRARPGLMGSAGPRYFGFVVGGSTDAALVADVMTAGWDQLAFNEVTSPAALAFEDVAGSWLKDLLGIPSTASVGFVTGAQAANTVGLAAARLQVLRDHGWDVGRDGLRDAPHVRVIAGAERHATIDRTLRLLGLGESALEIVSVRPDGAMDASALKAVLDQASSGPTIVCAQSGNVNTGAFDDLRQICTVAKRHGAWIHIDGAFGLWAGASSKLRNHVDGIELADSWGCDGHKWLNVPYDSGYAFCAQPTVHATAMGYTASYLTGQEEGRNFGGGDFVLESSRRARGFATWAALRGLGRSGVEELIDRCCDLTRRLANGLDAVDGVDVVNDVVLNQILVRVGDEPETDQISNAIQQTGDAWLGSTTWHGERLLRISVSNLVHHSDRHRSSNPYHRGSHPESSPRITVELGYQAGRVRRIGLPAHGQFDVFHNPRNTRRHRTPNLLVEGGGQ
jgi:glutamate/tyrosine decarboxylase-like PLP-dependent enzyme